MKTQARLSLLSFALMGAGLLSPQLQAANLNGKVRDANSGRPLQGASVQLEGVGSAQESGRDGRFFFTNIQPGEYQLQVDYLGAMSQQQTVVVTEEGSIDVVVELRAQEPEHIIVYGQAGGLSKSLNRERNSDRNISVLSADMAGNFPDTNISEALQRVPGLSVERDQGEGRFVRVRGMAPDYNAVSMNGAQLPAPESDRRAVALDVLPADLLQSVEVSKTLTPDMDADSLGGAIEVKSLSAFDYDDRYLSLSAEAGRDSLREKTNPKLAATFSDLLTDNFGVAMAVSWHDRDFGSDNVETGGDWDFDADEGFDPAKLKEVQQRDYEINRTRIGVGVNFDWRPNDNHDFYLRTLYSQFDDTETRNRNKIKWDEPVTEGVAGAVGSARTLKSREEKQSISSAVLGGQSRLQDWQFEYQLSASRAKAEKPRHIASADFEADFDSVSFHNTRIPHISAPDSFYQAESYELTEVEIADSSTDDDVLAVKFDATHSLNTALPAELKFGAKYKTRDKTNTETVWLYQDLVDQGIAESALAMTGYASADLDYRFGPFGPGINAAPVWQLVNSLNADDNLDDIESRVNDFDITEDIAAAYVMGHVDIEQLRLLAGVRYEYSDRTATGYGYNAVDNAFNQRSVDNDESHLLPSLHAKYQWGEDTIIRASYTQSLVRPTFGELAPGFIIEEDDGDLETAFGNPDLKPLESDNFDISLDHYLGGLNVISLSGFYKDLSHFIYQADLGGQGDYTDFSKAITFINGDDGHIYGAELSYVQEFGFLPDPFKGVIFTSNLTYTDSEVSISYQGDNGIESRHIPLPSQSDVTANASLGYEDAYFSFRVSAAYKSNYLVQVNELADSRYDLYEDDHLQWDLVAKAHLTDSLTLYFKGINLTDEPYNIYTGDVRFNGQYEEYGRTLQIGLQYVNF